MGLPINSRGRTVSVDQRCWDLAEVFLGRFRQLDATEAHIADLAEEIQRCCESAAGEAEDRQTIRRAQTV